MYCFDDKMHNPLADRVSIGYKYDINILFRKEAGTRVGGFSQKFRCRDNPSIGQNSLKSSI